MKKIIVLVICLVIGIMVYKKEGDIIIPSDAIRVRIIANSNNIKDLYNKTKLKESIKNDLYEIVKDAKNSNEASNSINSNINKIEKLVSSKTNDFKIEYGINHFPEKVYKGVRYPEGDYNSLVITLGSGLGDNWWCVLYPPLCIIEDNTTTSNVEYRSLIKDLLKIDSKK